MLIVEINIQIFSSNIQTESVTCFIKKTKKKLLWDSFHTNRCDNCFLLTFAFDVCISKTDTYPVYYENFVYFESFSQLFGSYSDGIEVTEAPENNVSKQTIMLDFCILLNHLILIRSITSMSSLYDIFMI